jgi:hypothetical protein
LALGLQLPFSPGSFPGTGVNPGQHRLVCFAGAVLFFALFLCAVLLLAVFAADFFAAVFLAGAFFAADFFAELFFAVAISV